LLLLAALAVAAVVVGVIVALTAGGDDNSSAETTSTSETTQSSRALLAGIPQQGTTLGKASAPATLVQYIDLQCPVCRDFETSVMPTIIARYVRTGKLKVISRPVVIIGPDSETGRRGMIAAFKQNRGFNFAQLLYFNQGPENGGWLDDSMVANAAASIPGVNVAALQKAAGSQAVKEQASTYDSQAQADGLSGTPTLVLGKSGGKLASLGAGSPSVDQLSASIDQVLKS
jgi:protein-disulfide isomerase